MARGGRGKKVVINSGKWRTVKSSKTNNDSDDEEVTKMTDADWQRYFEIMDDMQYHFVEQGELSSGLIQMFNHSLLIHILPPMTVYFSIQEEIMKTYCPETSDAYERVLAETKEWIQNNR